MEKSVSDRKNSVRKGPQSMDVCTHTHDEVPWCDWRYMCVWGVTKSRARNVGCR